jgi:hypothetical protein
LDGSYVVPRRSSKPRSPTSLLFFPDYKTEMKSFLDSEPIRGGFQSYVR